MSQTSAAGKTEPEQFTWTEPEEVAVFSSLSGDAQGTKFSADVVRTKASRPSVVVLKDGPHAGVAFPSDAVLLRLDLQTVRVKGREFTCSVLETSLKDPARTVRTWFSAALPLGAVKSEAEKSSTVLVDPETTGRAVPPSLAPPVIAKSIRRSRSRSPEPKPEPKPGAKPEPKRSPNPNPSPNLPGRAASRRRKIRRSA